jgi:glycogen synthase
MKILMTADTVGGVWVYALGLAQALAAYGADVALATMGAPLTSEQWQAANRLPNLSIYESDFKLEWMEDPWDDVQRAGDWLLTLEQKLRPDLVHLNGYAHAALPWRAPVLVVGHSCVLSWWQGVHGCDAPPCWDEYHRQVQRGLQAADLVVAPTRAMLHALQQHYGPLPPSRVVYNGCAPSHIGAEEKQPLILTAGRLWDAAKNVAALEQVAPRLAWPVYVAGDEHHPDGGQVHWDNLRLLGRLSPEALAPWFAHASIYALPARYEPFGLSALEAALAGCALILGDIPSLREVWGDAALFVNPNDTLALEAALNLLIVDTQRRHDLATRASHRAQRYTQQRMAESYWRLYKELADKRRPRAKPYHQRLEESLAIGD